MFVGHLQFISVKAINGQLGIATL